MAATACFLDAKPCPVQAAGIRKQRGLQLSLRHILTACWNHILPFSHPLNAFFTIVGLIKKPLALAWHLNRDDIRIHMFIYIYIHIDTYMYMYINICMQTYIRTYTTLQYITLHYITLHYITSHYITLRYISLHCTAWHYIAVHCITLHCIALHYTTLHFITVHCGTLH